MATTTPGTPDNEEKDKSRKPKGIMIEMKYETSPTYYIMTKKGFLRYHLKSLLINVTVKNEISII